MRVRSKLRDVARARGVALVIVGLALACAAISCKSDPPSGRALKRRGIGPVQLPGPTPLEATQPSDMGPVDPIAAGATPASAASPAAADDTKAKAERDFGAELARMMGNPVDCLIARVAANAPNQLDIALTTRVMPSGAVVQSEVQAADLTPSELTCVRNRMEGLHFAAPIENAPFTVQGNLRLTRAATVLAVAAPTPNPDAPSPDTPTSTPTGTAPAAANEPNAPVANPPDGVAQP